MFKIVAYLLCFFCIPVFAQKEAANWYFGNYAGLSFNPATPVALTDGQLSQLEGSATISDNNGNLLFYTNGIEVYNANHLLMPNGAGLYGSQSSTQSAIIVPAPGNSSIYYIFTVDSEGGTHGLTYSIVDMTLDNGLGDIISKNNPLDTPTTEKITAAYHSNGVDIWVIAHSLGNNKFLSYLVTASGVSNVPQFSLTGVNHAASAGLGAIGYMKTSPNGKKLALAKLVGPGITQLFDFDNTTGIVSNPLTVNTYASYGVEFSPDSKLLYTTSTGNFNSPIYQYNISLGSQAAIQASEINITPGIYNYTALQLAIDGKIYTVASGGESIHVIQNPGVAGLGCNFLQNVVSLDGKTSTYGLPPFIQNYFQYEINAENLCFGSTARLNIKTGSIISSASWNFGDIASGTLNTSDDIIAEHIFSAPGTYEVSVNFVTDLGHSITLKQEVIILPTPVANPAQDIKRCDALPNDDVATFNLSDQTNFILGNQAAADFNVTYHGNAIDAGAGENPLPLTNYSNTSNPQIIFARITDKKSGCYDITSFQLIVNGLPVIVNPDTLRTCEIQKGNGVGVFNLSEVVTQITGGDSGINIIFYNTAADVTNGLPVSNPGNFSNNSPYIQTIYFKAAYTNTPECYVTGSLDLIVNSIPNLKDDITNYLLCDINDPGDGFETFDLTTKQNEITSDLGQALEYYYEDSGEPVAILDPGAFTNTQPFEQTIYVFAQNQFGCKATTDFIIKVSNLPEAGPTRDFFACEEVSGQAMFDLSEVSLSLSQGNNYNVSFYQTPGQAQLGGPDYESSPYESASGMIYARISDNTTGCVNFAEVTLTVIPAPIAATPAPIAVCDFNNDGYAEFDMTATIAALQASLPDVVVTAHETQQDADFNVNVIPNPGQYTNVVQWGQSIYLRVQSTLTECYDTVILQLVVNRVPEAVTPSDYELCDDGANDTDGRATFNLNTKTAEILGALNPAQYTVTYHTTANDAADGTNAITNTGNYESATTAVYARVTNNATGCYDVVVLELIVNPLPVLLDIDHTYTLCDTTTPIDKEVFDLTSVIPAFVADASGMIITFHHSYDDALANVGAIDENETLAYENQVPQVEHLVVRFTYEATGCYRLGFLDLRVEHQPIILAPSQEDLTVCDTNGQGIGEFNLEELREDMANGDASLVITFHETEQDAISGANPIPNTTDYLNSVPYLQYIYVRVTDTRSGCVNAIPYRLTLIVEPAPQSPPLGDITLCDDQDANGQDGRRRVDLTVQNQVIADALGIDVDDIPAELIVEYYTTQAGANSGTANIIANPTTYMGSADQQIWVRVEDPQTGCYSIEDFYLRFDRPHALTTPAPLVLCDEALPNDNTTVFDLRVKDDEILGASGQGQGYSVDYYESDPRVTGVAAIATPESWTNPSSPMTLWVKVTTDKGCVSYTTLTIKVLPLPTPNAAPQALVKCDENNSPDGVEAFDLTQAAADIIANGSNYILSYYATEADAQAGTNPIPNPDAYVSGSGSVWVRVALDTHNPAEPMCHQLVELELIVNPLPPVNNLAPWAMCVPNPTGTFTFDIQDYVNTALGGNANNEYDVDFFTDAALTNPAVPVNNYPVSGNTPVTLYVRVVDNATTCRIVVPLQLIVEEQAVANPVTTVDFDQCDYDGANDGVISTWDLTLADADVLGAQPTPQYVVNYYHSEEDALNGVNPIPNPTAYTNQSPDSEVIWAGVTNTAATTPCRDAISFTLTVERLAEPVITGQGGSDTICVDADGTTDGLLLESGITANGHSFDWTLPDGSVVTTTDATYLAMAAGSYSVRVTGPGPNNCLSEPSEVFTVIQSGIASPVGRGYYVTNYFSDNQTITVQVEGNGEYVYRLDNGPEQESNVFTNVPPGQHTVYVRDVKTEFGCGEIPIEGVSVVDYPNFFTPNGDGFNDSWNIIGLQETGSVIYIFDRYGKLIKQISPDSQGWDGTFNGHQLPADDYWFTVTYPEFDGINTITKEFKAHFSLKR